MTEEARPTPPTTETTDNPMCTCCNPRQPLEPPQREDGYWICPITSKQYTYDPAMGTPQPVEAARERTPATTTEDDFFPQPPQRDRARRVRTDQDTFAAKIF